MAATTLAWQLISWFTPTVANKGRTATGLRKSNLCLLFVSQSDDVSRGRAR
jgi:hypothetical protein